MLGQLQCFSLVQMPMLLPQHSEEVEEDEILLIGQHDRPLDLQNPSKEAEVSKSVAFQNVQVSQLHVSRTSFHFCLCF